MKGGVAIVRGRDLFDKMLGVQRNYPMVEAGELKN